MSEKKYSNLTDTDVLTCLLNPHNLVSTKQTYIYHTCKFSRVRIIESVSDKKNLILELNQDLCNSFN